MFYLCICMWYLYGSSVKLFLFFVLHFPFILLVINNFLWLSFYRMKVVVKIKIHKTTVLSVGFYRYKTLLLILSEEH
jgi:hypothetical protein